MRTLTEQTQDAYAAIGRMELAVVALWGMADEDLANREDFLRDMLNISSAIETMQDKVRVIANKIRTDGIGKG